MQKVYNPLRFKIDSETREGLFVCLFLPAVLLVVILVLLIFVLPALYYLGEGDWIQGAKRFLSAFNRPIGDYLPILRSWLYVLIGGFLYLFFIRLILPDIVVSDDSIESHCLYMRLLGWLPAVKKIQSNAKIHFFDAESVFTDFLATGNGEFLYTVISSGPGRIVLRPGFIGYFEIMDLVETRAPQAAWDERTLLLVANHSRGVSVYRTERALRKELRQQLKGAMPSWWQRQKLMRRMRSKREFMFRALAAPHPEAGA